MQRAARARAREPRRDGLDCTTQRLVVPVLERADSVVERQEERLGPFRFKARIRKGYWKVVADEAPSLRRVVDKKRGVVGGDNFPVGHRSAAEPD